MGTRHWQFIIGCVAIVAFTLLVVNYLHNNCYGAITDPEILDFLQSARNISEGRGITTFVFRPINLSLGLSLNPLPEVYHPPLPLLTWGIIFAIIGQATQHIAVAIAGLWLGLTAALLLSLGCRYMPLRSALLSAGLFLLAPSSLRAGANGSPATLTTFLFVLWLVSWITTPELNIRRAVISGAILGAAGLCDGLTLLVVPVILLVDKRWRSWRERIAFILALTCVLFPYIWRNIRVGGYPFTLLKVYALLLDTKAFPQDSIYRCVLSTNADKILIQWSHLQNIWQKYMTNLKYLPTIASQWGWIIAVGSLLGALLLGWKRKAYLLYGAVVLMCIVSFLLLTRPRWDTTLFLTPFSCLLTSAFAESVLKRFSEAVDKWLRRRGSRLALTILPEMSKLLIIGLLLGGQAVEAWRMMRSVQPVRMNQVFVASIIPVRDSPGFVASDEPRVAAWYGRRPVAWLPCHQSDWEKVNSTWQISQIWLSPFAVFQRGGDLDTKVRISYVLQKPLLSMFSIESVKQNASSNIERQLRDQEGVIALAVSEAYIRRGQWKLAEQALRTGVHKAPSAWSFFRLGQVWSEMERHWDAVRAYQAALGEDPRFYPAANNLAWSYLEIGELRLAAYWAEYALKLAPNDPFVLDTAGIVALKQGHHRLAKRRLRQALKLAPDHPIIFKHWLYANR